MSSNRPFLAAIGAALFAAAAGVGLAVAASGAPPQQRNSDAVSEPGNLPSAEQVPLMRAAAEAQLGGKQYAAAIDSAKRFVKAGGAEAEIRPVLIQAYYSLGDFANAARELQWEVQAAERAGRAPGEDRLLLLQACYGKLNDATAFAWSLEKLVSWYPKRDYWADLLDRTEKRPDFGEVLSLDVNRLRLRTGALTGAPAYLKLIGQLQQAGLPAEALGVLARGMAQHVLGTGPDAQRQRQLQQALADAVLAQKRQLADPQVEAAALRASDGLPLVELGYALFTLGDADKGLQLMEQGLRKGGTMMGRPQFAKLHVGIATLTAGRKPRAIELFRTVGGRHGGADLGRLWAIYAQNGQ